LANPSRVGAVDRCRLSADLSPCQRPSWPRRPALSVGRQPVQIRGGMVDAGPGMIIKNTFLEVGNHQSLMEVSDWRRQMSDPCASFPRQISELSTTSDGDPGYPVKIFRKDSSENLNDSQGDVLDPCGGEKEETATRAPAAPAAKQQTPSGGASVPAAAGHDSKPPQVLLLADSIPASRRKGAKDGKAPGAERKEARLKDSQIQLIKNFDITHKEPPWTDVTTVMMRNLPNKYTQQMLLEELQDSGFRAGPDFDFFYLPMDHSNAANLGYCFINFTATAMANAFAAAFSQKRMRQFNSIKTVVVMPASIQGYERNHTYYSSTRVVQAEDPQYRPLFMKKSSGAAGAAARGAQGGARGGKGGAVEAGGGGAARVDKKGAVGAARADKKGARTKGAKGGVAKEVLGPMAAMPPLLNDYALLPGGVPWPGTHPAASAPAPAPAAPLQVFCTNCGNECNTSHRFCGFCGSQVGAAGATPASMQALPSSMRADAPTFVMPAGGDPWAPAPLYSMVTSPALEMPAPADAATDELDIMRGRMMLLAALKEMESRETTSSH